MTRFTAGLWRALRNYAPRDFRYDFDFDRNRKPSGSATDASTTQARPHGLFISVPGPPAFTCSVRGRAFPTMGI